MSSKRRATKLVPATSYPAIVGAVLAEFRSRRQFTLADVAAKVAWPRARSRASNTERPP